jgi:hypothetical protein
MGPYIFCAVVSVKVEPCVMKPFTLKLLVWLNRLPHSTCLILLDEFLHKGV